MKLALRSLTAVGSAFVLLIVWGVAIEPRFVLDEREEVASVPGLPAAWHDREIALLADLQIGMWLDNENMVARAIRAVISRRPAAVLIAGDFLYTPTDEERADFLEDLGEGEFGAPLAEKIRELTVLLEPLTRSGIPTYAVLGNHDYGMYWESSVKLPWVAERLTQALEGAGITVLRNQAVAMRPPAPTGGPGGTLRGDDDAHLYVGGIGPDYAGQADVGKTLAAIPPAAPRVLLMHNPRSFAQLPAGSAPLALAAHTHGGQVRIPGLPSWSWLKLAKDDEIRADGWIAEFYGAPGNRLYVNRGIGFSIVPIRINCPPEVTYFRLFAAAGG